MRTTLRKVIGGVLLACLAALVAWAPRAASAAEDGLRLVVRQEFATSSEAADGSFVYQLVALGDGHPMPDGSAEGAYAFALAFDSSVELGPIFFAEPGEYRYRLAQLVGSSPGYRYDQRAYQIVVHVDAALALEAVVYNEDGSKAGELVFVNSYQALPSDPGLMVDPPVRKTVSGEPDSEGRFTFRLVAGDAANPMPAGSVGGVKTIQVVGSGFGEFGTWSYERAGTYYYTAYEVDGGLAGYTYDRTVYTITDQVSDQDGQLVVQRVVTNHLNRPVSSLSFVNSYSAGSVPKPGVIGPHTGDDSQVAFYALLLAVGAALAVGGAGYLGAEVWAARGVAGGRGRATGGQAEGQRQGLGLGNWVVIEQQGADTGCQSTRLQGGLPVRWARRLRS